MLNREKDKRPPPSCVLSRWRPTSSPSLLLYRKLCDENQLGKEEHRSNTLTRLSLSLCKEKTSPWRVSFLCTTKI
jgi:hypothetical protein